MTGLAARAWQRWAGRGRSTELAFARSIIIRGYVLLALAFAAPPCTSKAESPVDSGPLQADSSETAAGAASCRRAASGSITLDFDANTWMQHGCSLVGSMPVMVAESQQRVRLDISRSSRLLFEDTDNRSTLGFSGTLRTHGGMLLDCGGQVLALSDFVLAPSANDHWVLSAGIDGDAEHRIEFAVVHPVVEADGAADGVRITGSLVLLPGNTRHVPAMTLANVEVGSLAAVLRLRDAENGVVHPPDETGWAKTITHKTASMSAPEVGGALVSVGADVIVGEIQSFRRWTRINGITAYSIGTVSCNVGDVPLNWFMKTPEHPVIAQNLYRLKDGRFEQIALSWVKHGFTASSGTLCSGPGQCIIEPTDQQLGVGCSDIYSNALNGFQANMGPRALVNPTTGEFPFPYDAPSFSGELDRRLQVADADLDPALNVGARYFAEAHYITSDDAADGNQDNNASFREFGVVETSPQVYNLSFSPGSATERGLSAIWAWAAADPQVRVAIVDIPGDRRLLVGARVTDLGDGRWDYEYAVQNLNSERAVGSFGVPLAAGVIVEEVRFRDIHDHSGAPFDTADWTTIVNPSELTWFTDEFADHPNANALRWGSLYNFRFVANVCPVDGQVRLGLFKPGNPSAVFAAVPIPSAPAMITFSEPPDGAIDARQPSDPDGQNVSGWQQVHIQWSGPPCRAFDTSDFHVTQVGGMAPAPVVAEVHALGNDELEIVLDRPIAVRAWTVITHGSGGGRVRLGFLPGDANADGVAAARDILALVDMLNGVREVPGPWSTDINRSGDSDAADIIRLIDLLNGSSQYERYFGARLPLMP